MSRSIVVAFLFMVLAASCGSGSDGSAVSVMGSDSVDDGAPQGTVPGGVSPGGDGEVPAPGPDGDVGPVGDTGGGSDDDDRGGVLLPSDRPGPLALYHGDRWVSVADQPLDLCDDSDAFVALKGRFLGPGEEISEHDLRKIEEERHFYQVYCGDSSTSVPTFNCELLDPEASSEVFDRARLALEELRSQYTGTGSFMDEVGIEFMRERGVECTDSSDSGLRYLYMTASGPGPIAATPEEARRLAEPKRSNPGYYESPLGYQAWCCSFVEAPIDDVVVLLDSVKVVDGTVRGFVQNQSATQFARGVTVSLGNNQWNYPTVSLGTNQWNYPLSVQPREIAPFEIEGWTSEADPAMSDFVVTSTLSTDVDISRSFRVATQIGAGYGYWEGTWEAFQNGIYPAFAVGEPPTGEFVYFEIQASLWGPESHPSLHEQIFSQTIPELKAFAAIVDDSGRVIEVFEPPKYTSWYDKSSEQTLTHQVTQFPVPPPVTYNGSFFVGFRFTWDTSTTQHPYIWVGGTQPQQADDQ